MSQPHIAVTTSSFAQFSREPLDMLEARGLRVTLNPLGRKLTEAEAVEQLRGCLGVIAGTEPLNSSVLAALPHLRVISRCGTGLDSVDLEAARARGITVRNTPDAPTQAVAELTLGMMLDLLRHISHMNRDLRTGTWKKRMGGLLCGRHVGIIGMGRIGSAVARLCAAFGAHVAYADPVSTRGEDFPRLPLDELLHRSDIVSLHCPLPAGNAELPPALKSIISPVKNEPSPTAPALQKIAGDIAPQDAPAQRPQQAQHNDNFPHALLGARELDALPQGTLLLNLARGGLVDEYALADRLRTGRLGGAALDVYAQEPYHGPLRELDNALLTPHCASYAREARVRMEMEAARNLLDALESRKV